MEQSLLAYQSSYENGLLILNGILGLILALRIYFVYADRSTRNWIWKGDAGSFVVGLKMVFLLAQICILIAIPHLFLFVSTFRIFIHEWINQLFIFLWIAIAIQELILSLTYSAKLKNDFVKRILFFLLSIFWFLGFGLSALLAERIWQEPQGMERISIGFPAEGKWRVMHGGATITTNVHGIDSTEAYAIDLICVDEDGQFFKNGGMALTDVLGYQKIIVSPVTAKVVEVIDSLSNQTVLHPIDTLNPNGNKIVLLTDKGLLVQLSHLSKNGIKVKIGDNVVKGQAIAECGSSGNTPWPILSVQVNHLKDKNSVPFVFENMTVNRWGFWQNQAELFLLRNDIIQAISKE